MIPFKIRFIVDEKTNDHLFFESNEKPFKGELYNIMDADGKSSEFKVKGVQKVVIRGDGSAASLEYHCIVERHDIRGVAIGFK